MSKILERANVLEENPVPKSPASLTTLYSPYHAVQLRGNVATDLSAIEQQEQKRRTRRAEEIRYTIHNRVIYIVVLDGEGRTFLTHFSHIESADGRALSLKALRIFEQASGQGLGFHDPKIVCMRPSEFIHEYGNYFLSVNLT